MVVGRTMHNADSMDGIKELLDAEAGEHFPVGVSAGQVKAALTEGSRATDNCSIRQTQLSGVELPFARVLTIKSEPHKRTDNRRRD